MDNTILINASSKSSLKRKLYFKKCTALVILLISISMLVITFAQLKASLNYIPVNFAIDILNNKKQADTAQLKNLLAITKLSINLDNNPRYWQSLSELLVYQALAQGLFNNEAIESLKQAEQDIKYGLSLAPANAFLWYRLAVVQSLLYRPSKKIVNSLLLSIMTGPNEVGYLIPRLNLSLMLFSSFSKDDLDFLRTQIINAFELSPENFLNTCVYNKERLNLITTLLNNKHPAIIYTIRLSFEKTHRQAF